LNGFRETHQCEEFDRDLTAVLALMLQRGMSSEKQVEAHMIVSKN